MKRMFTPRRRAPYDREEALGALSTFSHYAARICTLATVLCLAVGVIQVIIALNRFPAPIPEVLSWNSVGEGAPFNGQADYPIYGYLVSDAYLEATADDISRGARDHRYLLFDWDGTVPVAREAAQAITSFMGALLLIQGARFFHEIQLAGTPFTATTARRLKAAGSIAVAAVLVSNLTGLFISSLASTFYLTPVGSLRLGAWRVGTEATWVLALGLLLIAVGIAFDYGVVLQQQDDELL